MSDMNKSELLLSEQGLAGLGEGGTSQLGATSQAEHAGGQATHAENSELPGGEARDLGPGDVEKMFGPAKTPLERLREAGNVEENPAEMGGGGDPSETEIIKELQKYEGNWNTKTEADKDKLFPAWEMVLKAKLGSESAKKWCQDNKLSLELHGEVFRRLAAKRREEKMTVAERAQGLTGEFLIFREALPHLLGNKELVDKRAILAPQQGGQNAAKP